MAPPVPTKRGTPTGTKLDDGYQTLVTFDEDITASIWEKTVTPPGLDGGDKVDTTTMHNRIWRTGHPRALVTMTDFKVVAAYDPSIYTSLVVILNLEQTITVNFPDGSAVAFYGFLRLVEAGDMKEGEQPEMTCTITPTNQDPTTGNEEAPVYVLTIPPATLRREDEGDEEVSEMPAGTSAQPQRRQKPQARQPGTRTRRPAREMAGTT